MDKMKRKYPNTFQHELVNGAVGKTSITAAMQNKFDNDRRAPRRMALETEAPNFKAAYGCVKWRLNSLPANETVATQEEKRLELERIYTTVRSEAWNWETINNLVNETYGTLRQEINRQAETIEKLIKQRTKEREQEEDKIMRTWK